MKNIMVFGATGSIGVYTCTLLKEQGYNIIAVGRRKTDNGFFQGYNIPYYSVDIRNKSEFDKLPADIDSVIHLAGAMPAHMKGYDPYEYIDSIITGTLNVLEYMRSIGCNEIIFSQSIADIGYKFGSTEPINDDTEMKFPLNTDHSVYSIAKNASVDLIEHYNAKYGMAYYILRLPTIYGYYTNPYYYVDGQQKWLGYRYIIERAIKGETLEIWGNPKSMKEMVYIKDFVHLVDCCLKTDNMYGIYNVGCGKPISIEDQIHLIADTFAYDKKSEIIYCPEKPSSPQFVLNIEKSKTNLGYKPTWDFKKWIVDYKYYLETEPFAKIWGHRDEYIS